MMPLYTAQQVRDADSYAINKLGIPSIVLMENASRSVFEIIKQSYSEEGKISLGIICGKGNNGGDGFAIARHFINDGYIVKLISLGAEDELKGDAHTNFRVLKNLIAEYPESKIVVYNNPKDLSILEDCNIIIDAMLGTGTRGDLSDPYRTIVEKINEFNAQKIAVDLPTGVDLENSTGEIVFNADLTINLSEYKTGLFYGKGYKSSGAIVKGYIGIGDEYFKNISVTDYLIEPEDAFFGLPTKELDAHKYSAGKVLVIAGSDKLPGAAFFSANTVLKSGAGACFLAFPKSIKNLAKHKLESAIVLEYNDNGLGFLTDKNLEELQEKCDWADVIAIGPGLGREEITQKTILEIIQSNKSKKFVIDADAILALGNNEYKTINLKEKILTPHHNEFSKMLGLELIELQKNILTIGKQFSMGNSCYLVLKGAPTIIFNPNGESFINSTGNPGMAKFGTGDVLTGIIAGFISQSENLEENLISAVYIHSLAGDLLSEQKSEISYTATDLMRKIPNAIRFVINSFV
jgi:NAD(P)H-hydrate epimerase